MTLSDDDRMTEMINGYWITRLSMQRDLFVGRSSRQRARSGHTRSPAWQPL